eukprot:TRINITY_DN1694_c0_g1_i4.p2 TRINITY_DN1694_c0_g1~~TRINITY_DN1694_c0_g1_i4.p2  ORF type:complete len:106 (-),score=20.40 TRINITY_DN1694_c0_g1_i4:383-700(-)
MSVLENYHAATAFKLLARDELNFASNFPPEMWKEFRSLVLKLILATDMARHVEVLGMWKARTVTPAVDFGDAATRLLTLQVLVKCADLVNAARPWPVCHAWAEQV